MPYRSNFRVLAAALAVALFPLAADAAPFTAGNVVVYRVGDGVAGLVNTGAAVFLDEYTPTGTLVQSIALPTTLAGAQQPAIASGTATSEGLLTRSANGQFLVATAYGRALGGTGSISGTTAATVPRVIARIDSATNIDTSTALTDYADANNARGVASLDGTAFWATGGNGGLRYATLGAATSTQVSSTVTNLRQVAVYDDQLYVGTASGSAVRIGTVGTGTPSTTGETITNLPGFLTTGSPYGFVLLDLDVNVAGVDTLYVADDGAAGLGKFSLVAGNWVANGSVGVAADTYRGLTAIANGGSVTLFATRKGGSAAPGGGELVTLIDASGYNATLTGTPTLIATAANNTAFRGVALAPEAPIGGVMRITEFESTGAVGEFIEFTNIGDAPVDMTGWSFDDNSRTADVQPLGLFGTVQPGESVILAESTAAEFRADWNLCAGTKVIGNLSANLGGNDEINLFDANDVLVDRLTYPAAVANVTRYATPASVSTTAIVNAIATFATSANADAEGSYTSVQGDIGSPGISGVAAFDFDECIGDVNAPVVTVSPIGTSPRLDLGASGGGAASGDLRDPTDPAAPTGIASAFDDPNGDEALLAISVTSGNAAVVPNDAANLVLSGTGANRTLRIVPTGAGRSVITVQVTDAEAKVGTYLIDYAASAIAAAPAVTRFHTGASDASSAISVDTDTMLVSDDENQVLRLYPRANSGLQVTGFDFTAQLGLTDLDGGVPREVDIEAATRIGNRLYWSGSHGNQATGSNNARPNRRRVFATDLAGTGEAATLTYVDRYDFFLDDLRQWDQTNLHGLGANALGIVASTQPNVSPEIPSGFNVEGLALAPNGSSAYFGFRAPLLPDVAELPVTGGSTRDKALVVSVANLDALVVEAGAGSRAAGAATIGAPILLDLGGRGIRGMERNASGQYLILAGPVGPGAPVQTYRLFAWSGDPAAAPTELATDLTALAVDGAYEGIVSLPDTLGTGSTVQLVVDNGDSVYYGDGVVAKDLAERRHAKFRSVTVTVDYPLPADALFQDGFEQP